MIRNLDELIRYSEQVANSLPLIANKVRIVRIGSQPGIIATLTQVLPRLPESYLSVVESIAIDGISIGYFELTPSASHTMSLVEKLQIYNDPTFTPMFEYYQKHGVYQVASWEADPICIVHTDGKFKVGQVVKYNIDTPALAPMVLADNFEQLMLIAGNLQEISDKCDEFEKALNEFKTYLDSLLDGCRNEMELAWTRIANVVLG